MAIICVPYHLDERLPQASIPLPAEATAITPDFPDGALWERLGVLYDSVASAVATEIQSGSTPTVVSGDCLVALGVVTGAQRAGAGGRPRPGPGRSRLPGLRRYPPLLRRQCRPRSSGEGPAGLGILG